MTTLPGCLIWIEVPGINDPLFGSDNKAYLLRLAVYLDGKWINPQGDKFPEDMKVTHYMLIDKVPDEYEME